MYLVDGERLVDNHTTIDHAVPHCRSRVTYKSALQGRDAHTVWIGDVRIRPQAVQTDTYELNRNLLLTDGARADSVPNLEILCNDVICGHASSVGPLEEDHLYYLQSRGLRKERAERLLIRGFFTEVIDRLPTAKSTLTSRVDDDLEVERSAGLRDEAGYAPVADGGPGISGQQHPRASGPDHALPDNRDRRPVGRAVGRPVGDDPPAPPPRPAVA